MQYNILEWIKVPRERNPRIIRCDPTYTYFKPRGIPLTEIKQEVSITLEELETLRLTELEGHSQKEAGEKMAISQSTISRHLDSAHRKISRALLLGYAIRIENPFDFYHCDQCGHTWRTIESTDDVIKCESCGSMSFHFHSSQNEPRDL